MVQLQVQPGSAPREGPPAPPRPYHRNDGTGSGRGALRPAGRKELSAEVEGASTAAEGVCDIRDTGERWATEPLNASELQTERPVPRNNGL